MAQSVPASPATQMDVHVTGRRVIATLVDGVVLGFVFAVMSMLLGSSSAQGGQVSGSLEGLSALVYFVIVFAYYILMEGYLGRTVGKVLLGIKVVREDKDRKSTRLNSSHANISYAVFCLKKK